MPDLDDIFEDMVDEAKKWFKKRNKRRKKRVAAQRKGGSPTLTQRLFSRHQRAGTPTSRPRTEVEHPVKNPQLRGYLDQAQAYRAGLADLLHSAPTTFNRRRIEDLNRYIDHWEASLSALVEQVDAFEQNPVLQQDLKRVPEAIARLESQIQEATSDRLRQGLERTLASRRQQLSSLESLRSTMQWAEIKVENTVSILGAIYSQAVMSQSKGRVADYRRLLADVEEEARSLDDYVVALAEIKLGPSFPGVPSREESGDWLPAN